ncbi:SPOR domain-containing protein [Flavobacterium filum]|uniref:SPOR domain-containing protein n=1 Tax=Flavobacterium filum TaxID=370974 RepID=UPI0023F58F24|nr:SPOR domain-containing protein [Flavobacterium filum]
MQNNRRQYFLLALMLAIFNGGFAQLTVPFKERYNVTLKGDMTIIANSILNRIDKKNSPNDPYNDQSIDAITNDEADMEYIDIDNDKNTFSSSSAALFDKNEAGKKVVFAGLYWAATYKYESGYKKGEDKFVAFDKTRETFDEVLIKLPTKKEYIPVKGEVIFDGLKDKKMRDVAPYAVFADITEIVSTLENPFGFYTLANVKATQGTLLGGTAAGWTIVFVYEDESMSEKYIAINDGFGGASLNSIDIKFKNFETLAKGDVVIKMAASALEGDYQVDGDLVMFSSSTQPSFSNIKTFTRKYSNFFDSSITVEDEHFRYRIPDSKNTLGYDAFLSTLRNHNNSIISNNATEATVKFKTSGDLFYLFFCALSIEAKPEKVKEPQDNTKIVYVDNTFKKVDKDTNSEVARLELPKQKEKPVEVVSESKPEIKQNSVAVVNQPSAKNPKKQKSVTKDEAEQTQKETTTPKVQTKPSIAAVTDSKPSQANVKTEQKVSKPLQEEPKSSSIATSSLEQKMNIPNTPKGYYIVVNVFNERVNAARFMMKLRQDGLEPDYFINPENNYLYVFLTYYKNKEEAEKAKDSKLNNRYTEEMWILTVNID